MSKTKTVWLKEINYKAFDVADDVDIADIEKMYIDGTLMMTYEPNNKCESHLYADMKDNGHFERVF